MPVSLPRSSRRRRRSGFTLVEILLALALVGILATVVVLNVGNIFKGGQQDTAKLFVSNTKTLLQTYLFHVGRYPSTEQGLQALITRPAGSDGERWRGPYFEQSKVPEDPWKQPYQYRFPGERNPQSYDLWSNGPDTISGTDDDIGNWE